MCLKYTAFYTLQSTKLLFVYRSVIVNSLRILIDILHLIVGSHSSIGSTLLHHNISAVHEWGKRSTSTQFSIPGYLIDKSMSLATALLATVHANCEIDYINFSDKCKWPGNNARMNGTRTQLTPNVSLVCQLFLSACRNRAK